MGLQYETSSEPLPMDTPPRPVQVHPFSANDLEFNRGNANAESRKKIHAELKKESLKCKVARGGGNGSSRYAPKSWSRYIIAFLFANNPQGRGVPSKGGVAPENAIPPRSFSNIP